MCQTVGQRTPSSDEFDKGQVNLGLRGSTVFIALSAHKYKARFILKMPKFD
jgi:hypothetical protein